MRGVNPRITDANRYAFVFVHEIAVDVPSHDSHPIGLRLMVIARQMFVLFPLLFPPTF